MDSSDPKARSIKDLDAYALERWEVMLHYLVEKPQKADSVSRDTITTLTHAGLMYVHKTISFKLC